jgi:hypothetical protein
MRATRSRTITSLLAAVAAGFAVSAMIGAPTAVAQVCEPGQIEIDGQCTVPDNNANNVPAPQDGTGGPGMDGGGPVMGGGDSGMGGGDHGGGHGR